MSDEIFDCLLTFDGVRLVDWNLNFIWDFFDYFIRLWNLNGVFLNFLNFDWVLQDREIFLLSLNSSNFAQKNSHFLNDFVGLWNRHFNFIRDLLFDGVWNFLDHLIGHWIFLFNSDGFDVFMMIVRRMSPVSVMI